MNDSTRIFQSSTFQMPRAAGFVESRPSVLLVNQPDIDLTNLELNEDGVATGESYSKLRHWGQLTTVARISLNKRFVVIKRYANQYQLAVKVADTAPFTAVQIGWGTTYQEQLDRGVYRLVPGATYFTRARGRYNDSRTLADALEVAAGNAAALALVEDVFSVELPRELEHTFQQLVQLRSRDVRTSAGRLELDFYIGEERPLRNQLMARLVQAVDRPYAEDILTLAVNGAAREIVEGKRSSAEIGVVVTFVGEELDTTELVEQAHAEALTYVLERRANRDASVQAMNGQYAELQAELKAATVEELQVAERRLQETRELAKLAAHSPDDAAQRILDQGGRSSLFTGRGSYRICEDMARLSRELEVAEGDPIANTALELELQSS